MKKILILISLMSLVSCATSTNRSVANSKEKMSSPEIHKIRFGRF